MKLGMWDRVGQGTSVTHVVCRHLVFIVNTSFAYLFWLANNSKGTNPEFYMGYSDDENWYVGGSALMFYPCALLLLSSMHILITSFAYLFWLAIINKVKYSEFNIG